MGSRSNTGCGRNQRNCKNDIARGNSAPQGKNQKQKKKLGKKKLEDLRTSIKNMTASTGNKNAIQGNRSAPQFPNQFQKSDRTRK